MPSLKLDPKDTQIFVLRRQGTSPAVQVAGLFPRTPEVPDPAPVAFGTLPPSPAGSVGTGFPLRLGTAPYAAFRFGIVFPPGHTGKVVLDIRRPSDFKGGASIPDPAITLDLEGTAQNAGSPVAVLLDLEWPASGGGEQ
jgi:hypothetical protein